MQVSEKRNDAKSKYIDAIYSFIICVRDELEKEVKDLARRLFFISSSDESIKYREQHIQAEISDRRYNDARDNKRYSDDDIQEDV